MERQLRTFRVVDIEGKNHEFQADGGVFDFDGTIARNWEELLRKTQEELLLKAGFVCPSHSILSGKGAEVVQHLMREAQPTDKRNLFDTEWPEIFRRFCERTGEILDSPTFQMEIYPDTAEFIERMGPLPRGVATNSSKDLYERRSAKTPGFEALGVSAVRTRSCVLSGKPDSKMLEEVQRALRVNRPFMAGDTMVDALAGKNAGWPTLINARDRAFEALAPFRAISGVILVRSFADVHLD